MILILPPPYAPWLMIQNEQRQTCRLLPFYCIKWFQKSFKALPGHFFNVSIKYYTLSVMNNILFSRVMAPVFLHESFNPYYSGWHQKSYAYYKPITFLGYFSKYFIHFTTLAYCYTASLTPHNFLSLNTAAFSRPYLRHHSCFLFLLLLRYFNSESSLTQFFKSAHTLQNVSFSFRHVHMQDIYFYCAPFRC